MSSSMVTIRMRRSLAEALDSHLDGIFGWAEVRRDLEAALKPKRYPRARQAARKAKRETKREETARIRAEVFDRAEGRCEGMLNPRDPSRGRCGVPPAEWHHIFGRVRVQQSARNGAALCRACHSDATQNHPDALVWWRWWSEHFERLGYTEEARRARALLHKHEVKAQLGAKP